MIKVISSRTALIENLKSATDQYERSKTYHTAVAVQTARRNLEEFYRIERSSFKLHVCEHPVSNPDYVPPSHWRIIDGGKKDFVLPPRGKVPCNTN